MEVVIVDNASEDGTPEIGESTPLPFPVTLIRNGTNTGFAAGMNRALAVSTSEFAFLLNPDARLVPDALQILHERMASEDATVYAVGPKLLRATGRSSARLRRSTPPVS